MVKICARGLGLELRFLPAWIADVSDGTCRDGEKREDTTQTPVNQEFVTYLDRKQEQASHARSRPVPDHPARPQIPGQNQ
jgi:hypothetical protein